MTSSPIDPSSSATASDSAPYRPSVPIFLYRELAEELRETQAQLDFFKAQNRLLLQQNQQLRQEAVNILGSTRKLEQAITGEESKNQGERKRSPEPSPVPGIPEQLEGLTIQPARNCPVDSDYRPPLGSWRLVAIFSIIALFAFGIGFLTAPSLINAIKGNNR